MNDPASAKKKKQQNFGKKKKRANFRSNDVSHLRKWSLIRKRVD